MTRDNTSPPGPDSSDSVVILIDGPVDNEVRPCRPSLRALLKAESEKLARYREMMRAKERGSGNATDEPRPE